MGITCTKLIDSTVSAGLADPWVRLAAAVLLQAVRDARKTTQPIEAIDGLLFLSGETCPIYLDAIGIDLDPGVILGRI